MAVTLKKPTLSVDLGNVIDSAVVAVKSVRKREQARREAEFQRAIANGLSYEDQVSMRESQLKEEGDSSFSDPEYISTLEKSISDTKKLGRFNKYRTRYAEALGELSSGKINEEQYLSALRNTLDGVVDQELRLEIQNDVTTAEGKLKTYKDTIISNQVKKAKYDGTQTALNDVISRINTARTSAVMSNNEDEVTAYDETLSALRSQLSTVKIQDAVTDYQVNSSTRGVNPIDKLNFINNQISQADPNTPIKVGDRNYASAQQFWSTERDNFLAGNSQVFGDFFGDLNTTTKNAIGANTAKFGYPTQTVLDDTIATFNDLRSKPEVAPFVSKLDATQASVMSDAVDKIAKVINDVGTNNLTFQAADIQLQNIAKKYGIDTSGYRLQLDESLRNLARGGVVDTKEATELAPDVEVELPTVDSPTANLGVTPLASTTPTIPATQTGERIIQGGDTLSGIARDAGVTLDQLLEANPQYKTNPNIIRPGQKLVLPTAGVPVAVAAPVVPATPAAAPTAPSPTPVIPVQTTIPAAPAQPTQQTPAPEPITTQPPQTRVVKAGENLTLISKEAGLTLDQLISLNPQYKTNPNLIKPGESIKLK